MKNISYYIGMLVFIWAITKPIYSENYKSWEMVLFIAVSVLFILVLKKFNFFKGRKTKRNDGLENTE